MEIMPVVVNEKEAKEVKAAKINRFAGKFVTFALNENSMRTCRRSCLVWCNEDRDGNKIRTLIHSGEILARIVFTNPPQIVVEDYTKVEDHSAGKFRVHRYGEVIRYFLEKFGFPTASEEDLKQFMRKKEVVKETVVKEVVKEVEKKPEVAHWVKNCSPRNANDIWYTCSKCGAVANADNNVDILSDFCPHCGAPMNNSKAVTNNVAKNNVMKKTNLNAHSIVSNDSIGKRKFSVNGETYTVSVEYKSGFRYGSGKVLSIKNNAGKEVDMISTFSGKSVIGKTINHVYETNKRGYLAEAEATQLKIA